MTRCSVQPRDYGFLPFAKNMGRNLSKNWSGKYSQKLLDYAKQPDRDTPKTSSERVIQKTAEATWDLIGNKIVDKITRVPITSPQNNSETNEEILREKYTSTELRQKVTDDLRLNEG